MSNDYAPFATLYDLFYADFEDDLDLYLGFAERTGGAILEIGSGTGRVSIALAGEEHRVTGVELSAEMIAIARQKIEASGLSNQVNLIQADMRHFKLDDHFGLAIVPLNTFLHNLTLDDQFATLNSIKRHLTPNGLLVLDCFIPDPTTIDDRRLILQRSAIDRTTGTTAQLFLSRSTDWAKQRQDITYFIDRADRSGQVQRTVFDTSFRFIYYNEMQLLLKLGGFELKEVYGSYELDPFDSASDKMIVVAAPT
jgi:ubiquinone/menaquinone biosynthesis C-methylase UbiE